MTISKEQIRKEWDAWPMDDKPWLCPVCETLLSTKHHLECNGTDPFLPKSEWNEHEPVKATGPISVSEFTELMTKWYEKIENLPKQEKFQTFEERELKPAEQMFSEMKLSPELEKTFEEYISSNVAGDDQ